MPKTDTTDTQTSTASDAPWSPPVIVQSDGLPGETRSTIRDPNTGKLVNSTDELEPAAQTAPGPDTNPPKEKKP
jgi:hypothetical protein